MLLRSCCSGHTIIRFHTLYVNQSPPPKTEETPTNCSAGKSHVNVDSFTDHELSLVPGKTGETSFQYGWTWTNSSSWTLKRSWFLVSDCKRIWRNLQELEGTSKNLKEPGGKLKTPYGSWRHLKAPEGTWRHLKPPEGTWRPLKALEGTWKNLKAPESTSKNLKVLYYFKAPEGFWKNLKEPGWTWTYQNYHSQLHRKYFWSTPIVLQLHMLEK